MKLQNTVYNHLRTISSVLSIAVILLVLYVFFHHYEGALIIFVIGFLFDAIPAFFLHFEYYYHNKDEIYTITSDGITQCKAGEKHYFDTKDIQKIIIHKSASMDAGGMPFSSMEHYYYARIITVAGKELIITRLLTPEVEEAVRQLKGVPVQRVKRLFATTLW